jgi:hypothetical protein
MEGGHLLLVIGGFGSERERLEQERERLEQERGSLFLVEGGAAACSMFSPLRE